MSTTPGLPTEEEIARALFEFATCTDLAQGPAAVDANAHAFARAILALIRPAFEAKEREIEGLACNLDAILSDHSDTLAMLVEANGKRKATEAKLTQAVEALEPFAGVADTEEEAGRDDPEDDRILVVQAHGCQLAELTTEDFRRARSASAAAKGETK